MKSFDYYNPVKILFGEGKIAQIPAELKQGDKILLTYGGGSIKKNGTYSKVMEALQGFRVVEFGGIEANPKYETLMRAAQTAREQGVGFILAVGGGSVIDGTKFVAAAALYTGKDPWDILAKGTEVEQALPFGAVLTLPATGSEMNSGAVISRLSTKEKLSFRSPLLFPKFSVLDPTTTLSLPPQQVANGVVDAFIHVMEQYLTYPSNSPVQDRFAESILKTLLEVGPCTLSNPNDLAHRANFMWSCTMALNGLIATGVPTDWATHMIGHELTALFGLDHAVTLAIVHPALLREMAEFKREKLLRYGEEVLGIKNDGSPQTAERVVAQTEEFFRSLGMKTTLREHGITTEQVAPIVERFRERGWKLGEQRNITHDVVERILRRALG